MRRVLIPTVRWTVLALVTTAAWLLLPFSPFRGRVWPALALGALYATFWPLSGELGRRVRKPRPNELCKAAWRTYSGERRGRWREGRLDLVDGGVAAFTTNGRPGPRLDAATVELLGDRPLTVVEALWMGDRRRVLELTAGGQRVDVAVDAGDLPVAGRLIGAGHGSDGGGESR